MFFNVIKLKHHNSWQMDILWCLQGSTWIIHQFKHLIFSSKKFKPLNSSYGSPEKQGEKRNYSHPIFYMMYAYIHFLLCTYLYRKGNPYTKYTSLKSLLTHIRMCTFTWNCCLHIPFLPVFFQIYTFQWPSPLLFWWLYNIPFYWHVITYSTISLLWEL